jgi:hypothetical protein
MKEAIIFDSLVTRVGGLYQSLASNAGSYITAVNFCYEEFNSELNNN